MVKRFSRQARFADAFSHLRTGFVNPTQESEVPMPELLCESIGHVWQATGLTGWYRCVRSKKCRAVGVCPACVSLSSVPAGVELLACQVHEGVSVVSGAAALDRR